jgi:hypothetical protein
MRNRQRERLLTMARIPNTPIGMSGQWTNNPRCEDVIAFRPDS